MAAIRKYLPKTARRAIKARERARIIKKIHFDSGSVQRCSRCKHLC